MQEAVRNSWTEATTGPDRALNDVLEAGTEGFRAALLTAQRECPVSKPIMSALKALLSPSKAASLAELEKVGKDYRLNPADGVLEREVYVIRALIWVPVMPSTVIAAHLFDGPVSELTWRRYAFDQSHNTFLLSSAIRADMAKSQTDGVLARDV